MAQPPDMCQRPSWRCYINHHNLSLSLHLPLSPSIISISRSLYLSHCLLCSPPPSRLVFSPPIRPLWLCQFASLLNFSQTARWLCCCETRGNQRKGGGGKGGGQPDRGRKVQGRRSASFMIGSPAHRQEIDRKVSAICKTMAAVKEQGLVFSPPSLRGLKTP